MIDIDITDWRYAEPMYHYVMDNEEIYKDYKDHYQIQKLSIAEYVASFKKEEFVRFIHEKYEV